MELKYEPIITRIMPLNGIQRIFKFENGYGASVVKHEHSYGNEDDLWELAVIVFNANGGWEITYNTSVTGDVVGWLSNKEVQEYLEKIQALNQVEK